MEGSNKDEVGEIFDGIDFNFDANLNPDSVFNLLSQCYIDELIYWYKNNPLYWYYWCLCSSENFDLRQISSPSLEETQFSVCNFQEFCKRIYNVWQLLQLKSDDKISFESRVRCILSKNSSFDSWYLESVSFWQLCKYLISVKLWDWIFEIENKYSV